MGAKAESLRGTRQRKRVGSFDSLGYRPPISQTRIGAAPPRRPRERASILIHRAPIAQLVELRTFNPQVPGSSPGGGTHMRSTHWARDGPGEKGPSKYCVSRTTWAPSNSMMLTT
jgi:hypothetical protein